MWQLIEQHRSPDGLLTLRVECEDDGDLCIGFDGCSWHTHGDILASLSGVGEDKAVRQFVDDLLAGRTIIAVARVRGEIRDAWVTEDPIPDKYKPHDETIEFRYWDGRLVD